MSKSVILGSHTSSRRDSWWYLEQDDDGSLWVRHENDDDSSGNWRKPLHQVLAEGDRRLVQDRIDRMFMD